MLPKEDPDEENRLDFEILKRQLATKKPSTATDGLTSPSGSVVSSNPSSTDADQDVWPLQLNTLRVDHYIFGDVIGNGSYAEVRECIHTESLERCAVKIVNKDYLRRQNPGALANQHQEIKLLRRLEHKNIIQMKECLYKGARIYIVLEHCTFVLSDLLNEQPDNKLSATLARNLFNQLICGLGYLHSVGVVHRDIKPQNLLIKTCGTLKIIDFGVSQMLSIWSTTDRCSNYEGSPLFQAPEVVSGQREYSGFKVDIWSSGVTLYLILFGYHPFSAESLLALYDKILGEDLHVPTSQGLVVTDLLAMMLDKVSTRRASIEQILEHPWLRFRESSDETHDTLGQHSEFIELTQLHTSSSGEDGAGSRNLVTKDVYQSMSVLPYLHQYHFPQYPITRAKRASVLSESIFGGRKTNTDGSISSSGSSTSSDISTPSSSAPSSPNPHEVISEAPIEWGTESQYNLMKVPLIRANRVKSSIGRRRHKRKKVNRRRSANGAS